MPKAATESTFMGSESPLERFLGADLDATGSRLQAESDFLP